MRGTLIFDGGCGFCTRSRDLVASMDRHHRVRTLPLQADGADRQAGVSRERLGESVCWLDEDGARYHGAEAVNAAVSAALGTRLPLRVYRLPGMRRVQEAV